MSLRFGIFLGLAIGLHAWLLLTKTESRRRDAVLPMVSGEIAFSLRPAPSLAPIPPQPPQQKPPEKQPEKPDPPKPKEQPKPKPPEVKPPPTVLKTDAKTEKKTSEPPKQPPKKEELKKEPPPKVNEEAPPPKPMEPEPVDVKPSPPPQPASMGAPEKKRGVRSEAQFYGTPEPDYPLEALRNGWEGTVLLHIDVAADGAIKARVVRSSGYSMLDEQAVRWLESMRAQPATLDGKPIPWTYEKPVRFRLNR
jgi:protein TonB